MPDIPVESVNRTVEKTHEWLRELMMEDGFAHEEQAFSGLRAVLHTLRDRITVEEAADLGAQLPMLIRGVYYESWRPAATPSKERTLGEFLESVAGKLPRNAPDPEKVCRNVFRLLSRRITEGEVRDVRQMLPKPIQHLWP